MGGQAPLELGSLTQLSEVRVLVTLSSTETGSGIDASRRHAALPVDMQGVAASRVCKWTSCLMRLRAGHHCEPVAGGGDAEVWDNSRLLLKVLSSDFVQRTQSLTESRCLS